MEYRPSLPEHNDNVSHDKPIREFALLLFGTIAFLMIAFWSLALFVDQAVDSMSPEVEAILFPSADGSESQLIDGNNSRQAELQRMVDALQECTNLTYPLKIQLVDAEDVNALALPGGRIIVFNGLLDKVSSENGLSFILAHELAHFINRDHLRGMGRAIVLIVVASLITGADSGFTQLLAPAVDFGHAQYSQGRESSADQQALRILNCHYGHAGGATELFEIMKLDDQKSSNVLGHYFSSHPEAEQRIKNIHQLATKLNLVTEEVRELPVALSR